MTTMTSATEQVPVGVLIRVSDRKQTDGASPDNQRDACQAHAERQGWQVAMVEYDGGKSGTNFERGGYQRLLSAAKQGTIRGLVVWNMSRFGRADLSATVKEFEEFRAAGCFIATTDVILLQPIDILAERFDITGQVLANAYLSARLARDVPPNMARRVQEGKWVSSAPFGYRVVPATDGKGSTLEPDDNAWAVAEIFRLAAAGATEKVLLAFVNTHGLRSSRSKTGKTLNRTSIRTMLENPAYIGKVVWNRRGVGKFRIKGRRPASEVVAADGLHSPLVDMDTWSRVQQRLAERRTYRVNRKTRSYAIDGLTWCGQCASPMRVHQHIIRGRYDYRDLYCAGRHDRHDCIQPRVSYDRIWEQVQGLILDAIFPLGSSRQVGFADYLQRFRQQRQDAGASACALRDRLAERRKELDEQRYRVIDMELEGRITAEEADRKRAEIGRDIAAIVSELERLPAETPEPEPIIDRLVELACKLGSVCAAAEYHEVTERYEALLAEFAAELDADQWKALARILIRRIELVGNLKDGHIILQWTDTAKALLYEQDVVSRLMQTGCRPLVAPRSRRLRDEGRREVRKRALASPLRSGRASESRASAWAIVARE